MRWTRLARIAVAGLAFALPAAAAPEPRFGTAIAIDPSGYFVTALEVVEGPGTAFVILGEETLPAQVRALDEESGLALLSVDRTGLPAARLGFMQAGEKEQPIYLVGIPGPPALPRAIVLGGRIAKDPDDPEEFVLEFPKSVPPGLVGGAVVNLIGQVIGLAGADGSGPFVPTSDLWGMARKVPSPAPTIPGTPMEPGEGAAGALRLYGGGIARVRFDPGTEKKPGTPAGGAPPPPYRRGGEFAVGAPSGGLDVVQVDDGRVLRCRVGAADPKTGAYPIEIAGRSLVLPKARVARVLYFRDFDPAPRNEDEKGMIARGLARWKGSWIAKPRADEARRAAEAALAARLADERRPWEDRRTFETENFSIESNLPDRRVEAFGRLLEEYGSHLTQYLPRGAIYGKVPVSVFREREDFRDFAEQDVGKVGEYTVGYFAFQGGFDVHLALFDLPGDERETVRVLLHEATHLYLHLANASDVDDKTFPMWLNEGLAEYLGGADFRSGSFREGTLQEERLLWLQDMIARGRFIPLERLTMPGRNPGFSLDHYAESWAFVHFLMHGRNSAYRGGFKNYVVAGATPFRGSNFEFADSLLQLLHRDDFKKVTDEFQEYVRGLKFTSGVAYARRAKDRRERKEDAKAVLADLEVALHAGPKDPETLKAVAAVLGQEEGKAAEAIALLRRALEIDPLDVEARRLLVRLLPGEERAAEAALCEALGR